VKIELRVALVELRNRVADGKCRSYGSLRIVPVRARRPEKSDDCVADEFLDGPAEADQITANALVVRNEHAVNVLGIDAFCAFGRSDDIAEERGDDLALLRSAGSFRVWERCSAGPAELEPVWAIGTAAFARHVPMA
jgi:hypothetical protein